MVTLSTPFAEYRDKKDPLASLSEHSIKQVFSSSGEFLKVQFPGVHESAI